jgi:hypothetical protein
VTPDFNLCDVCGERVPERDRIFVATDYTHNGIENVTEGKHLDLCSKHLVEVVKHLIGAGPGQIQNFEQGKKVIAFVESLKRKR